MKVFSKMGSPEFNASIEGVLNDLSRDVAEASQGRCLALILAGGYGRGEGACVMRDGKESLYNDLDLFVVMNRPGRLPASLGNVTEKYEQLLNIEVDIGRPLTPRAIQTLAHELMWQDLINGHMVLMGDPEILNTLAPAYLKDPLPAVEALRLMLNRGSGLLQAMIAHEQGSHRHDKDFIRRNYQKCMLALGDSLLITHGCYLDALTQRIEQLEQVSSRHQVPHGKSIVQRYKQAAAFKLNPDSLSYEQPGAQLLHEAAGLWSDVLLYNESQRTGVQWDSVQAYCKDPFVREVKQHQGVYRLLKNALLQAKSGRLSLKHPREMLYRTLPELLRRDTDRTTGDDQFLRAWRLFN